MDLHGHALNDKIRYQLAKNGDLLKARYNRLLEDAKFNYFFLISLFILVGSGLGGITIHFILRANAPIWQLCLNVYLTMASNVACIGQAPVKWVIALFGISALTNVILILSNVL